MEVIPKPLSRARKKWNLCFKSGDDSKKGLIKGEWKFPRKSFYTIPSFMRPASLIIF
jgi:hypothetical protein